MKQGVTLHVVRGSDCKGFLSTYITNLSRFINAWKHLWGFSSTHRDKLEMEFTSVCVDIVVVMVFQVPGLNLDVIVD